MKVRHPLKDHYVYRRGRVTISLSSRYSKDERIGEIRAKAAEIRKQTTPFLNTLSTVLKEATGGS